MPEKNGIKNRERKTREKVLILFPARFRSRLIPNIIKLFPSILEFKVLKLFISRIKFDELAFKYFIANLNKMQKYYEFIFLAENMAYLTKKKYSETQLINLFSENMPNVNADCYINIVKTGIEGNLFYITSKADRSVAFITTDEWKKKYSPPSLFLYLLHSIVACLMEFHPKIKSIPCHRKETKGCINDYTLYKTDNKVDIALGYICDECKNIIIKNAGKDYYNMIINVVSNKWIGDISLNNSIAYDLKRYFNVNIDEDSGFNKTVWEKIKEYFEKEAVEKIIKLIFLIIFTIILTIFGINLKEMM